ncbi:MAG TPA: cupredoxin domain-containing protein [Candidatus Limnocylindria bacterium]|jgi:plastocyanin|nr:cupredoxin domain-containing protein [Candidatus Limnocylindria bacterium]
MTRLRSAALVGVVAAALAGGCGSAATEAPALAPAITPAAPPAITLGIAAEESVFDPAGLVVPADAPFALRFDNRDAVPHNVAIAGAGPGYSGEVFIGPATRTYSFAPLTAGSYMFICDVHPEMVGTLLATEDGDGR